MSTTPQASSEIPPVFIILGATGGIGSALSQRLARNGAQLVIGARHASKLHALAADIGAHAHALDATNADAVQACVDQTVAHFGRLDGIANCVGSLLLKPAHLTTDAEWTEALVGRIGEPSDVASAIAWLLDPEQSWVTGRVLSVDGGMSSVKPADWGAGQRS